ncbi:Leucine rich repeat flightless interacting [Fasciola hepatica]|uniref:Leucine rich repeat flightless interacting n=1 Tax=Fasciola hepatica TaxID=6192 RepID=A0A4E0S0W1_FASHE|nr:Leucine rich repeat flightless interacting [Fasciola hepatica]
MSNRHVHRADISDMGRAAEETEVQRAANKQLMEEGRIIRSKELERRRREEENGYDNYKSQDASNKVSSNGGPSRYSSQRSSIELSSSASSSSRNVDARELRMQLIQLEEKFKGAMMANVQLDNDKQLLRYEVDLLKDKLEDLTDSNASLHKSFLEKKRDLAYERMQVAELNHRLDFARKQIEARDQLLIEHDLILLGGSGVDDAPPLPADQKPPPDPDGEGAPAAGAKGHDGKQEKRVPNGFADSERSKPETLPSMALVSKSTADMLNNLGEPSLEAQILRLFEIRKELTARVEKLENDLETERSQPGPVSRYESRTRYAQSQEAELKQDLHNLRSQAQEYKYKLQEALQRNTALESDIVRLEGQIKRYKTIAESCEQEEAALKQEIRQHIRQIREVKSELEDYKVTNARLQRKLDKLDRSSVAPTSLVSTSLRNARDSSAHR